MQEIRIFLFGVLVCVALIWNILLYILFKILEKRHPDKFDAMSKPSMMSNDTVEMEMVIKFLLKREWRELNNHNLAWIGYCLWVLFPVFIILFAVLSCSIVFNI